MRRRDFISNVAAGAGAAILVRPGTVPAVGSQGNADVEADRTPIIDAHCHAGHGVDSGKPGGPYDP